MTVNLKIKSNPTRAYPQSGDEDYGSEATSWAQDVTTTLNATPSTYEVGQYDYVMGSAAQVTAGQATHSNWTTLLAAASDGDSVFVLSGTYSFAATFEFTKRLTIINQSSDCTYASAAGLGAGAILKFSAAGTRFIGGTISASAGTPNYAIELNALNIIIETSISGVYVTDYILFTLGLANFAGQIRTPIDSRIYGNTSPLSAANNTLSNLVNPTSINQDLIPDGNMTRAIGSDSKEQSAVWTQQIEHNDAGTPSLEIKTTGNNGDIVLTPHGIGKAKTDNLTLHSDTLSNTSNDLTLEAEAAGKNIILKVPSDGKPTTTIGATNYNLAYGVPIINFTTVGNIGDTDQFMAGNDYTLAELQHFFTAPKVISYNRFGAGAALGTDEVGTYNYTLGAAGKAPANTTGIMNTNFGILFSGGQYATHATKFDNFTTLFSGAGKGLVHSFWVQATSDGQPAASARIFHKENSAANDTYLFYLSTTGQFIILTNGNSATSKTLTSTTVLPNGANTIWVHVVVCWDTTYGLRLYINGVCEAIDSTATTLMVDGTTLDFFIGGSDSTPSNPFTGKIANEVVINKVAEQRDIDILFAATVPEPAALTGKSYQIVGFKQPEGDTNFEIQIQPQILAKYNSKIYLDGRQFGEADKIKLIGQVL